MAYIILNTITGTGSRVKVTQNYVSGCRRVNIQSVHVIKQQGVMRDVQIRVMEILSGQHCSGQF